MTPPKRMQTATERDLAGAAERKRRDAAAPEYVCEDVTGQHDLSEGELLQAREERAAANPARRIALIETDLKELNGKVGGIENRCGRIEVSVADIRGDQKAQGATLTAINGTLTRMANREQIAFAAKTEVETAEQKDSIAARSVRRKFWFAAAAWILTGGALGKLLHWLGVF